LCTSFPESSIVTMAAIIRSTAILALLTSLATSVAAASGSGITTRYWDCCKPSYVSLVTHNPQGHLLTNKTAAHGTSSTGSESAPPSRPATSMTNPWILTMSSQDVQVGEHTCALTRPPGRSLLIWLTALLLCRLPRTPAVNATSSHLRVGLLPAKR